MLRVCGKIIGLSALIPVVAGIVLCSVAKPVSAAWNNPYPEQDEGNNTLYSAFRERPKFLDPVRAYSSNEYNFLAQIYEPPFQYHYLNRPYKLIPLTAKSIPEPVFLDKNKKELSAGAPITKIAYSVYTIEIQPGIMYQPHPCFARDSAGNLLYHALTAKDLKQIDGIADFKFTGSRELVAADYVYQIKRIMHPYSHSPLLSLMGEHIVGMQDLAAEINRDLQTAKQNNDSAKIDLRQYDVEGVQVLDRYRYQIIVNGKYPQFLYWMAMPFFAPMPVEADLFFSQPGMKQKNLTLYWYTVGTGPYMLTVNDPNRRMVLARNPNYRIDPYPEEGEPLDGDNGLLIDSGKPMPFIDKVVFSLEKEDIPYWNKFLQGYYDQSGISAESFDQAVQVGAGGDMTLTKEMEQKGIQLLTTVETSIFYLGFNMNDAVVGGYSEQARKLRRSISIAIDFEEMISIFRNGRGIPAQGPIPPGIFGNKPGQAGINSYIYDWQGSSARRKPIRIARQLLAEAGYPNGRDAKTGKPLLLYFDSTGTAPQDKARLEWVRKQFKKINVELVVRATDYNRFQDKIRNGTAQMFMWGWNADYPDPENFLFLLYGPNKKVEKGGVNSVGYDNPEFNRLFVKMKDMDNSRERQAVIDTMVEIVRRDAPWAWGLHPKKYTLNHSWMTNSKPNLMANNTLKYQRLDAGLRTTMRGKWNKPVIWPLPVIFIIIVSLIVPAIILYKKKENQTLT